MPTKKTGNIAGAPGNGGGSDLGAESKMVEQSSSLRLYRVPRAQLRKTMHNQTDVELPVIDHEWALDQLQVIW